MSDEEYANRNKKGEVWAAGICIAGMAAELATSLRACEKQLVTCAHAYRAADNFDEAQRCSDIAFTARLVLQKWEEQ